MITRHAIRLVCAALLLGFLFVSCKKSESGPSSSSDTNEQDTHAGWGTLSFNAGSLGNFSFSGSWTGASSGSSGSGVEALTGNSGTKYGAVVYGYAWHGNNNWENVMLEMLETGTPVTTGTYSVGGTDTELAFTFSKGGATFSDVSNQFIMTGGSCTITSYTSTGMRGTFSGTATNYHTQPQVTVQITNGAFDVTFGSMSMY